MALDWVAVGAGGSAPMHPETQSAANTETRNAVFRRASGTNLDGSGLWLHGNAATQQRSDVQGHPAQPADPRHSPENSGVTGASKSPAAWPRAYISPTARLTSAGASSVS